VLDLIFALKPTQQTVLLTQLAENAFHVGFGFFSLCQAAKKVREAQGRGTALSTCWFLGFGKLKRGQRLVLWQRPQTPLGP